MRSSRSVRNTAALLTLAVSAALGIGPNEVQATTLFADDFSANTANNVVPAGWSSYVNFTKGPTATGTSTPGIFRTTGLGAGHPFYGHNWPDNGDDQGRFIAASGGGPSPSDIDLWTVTPALAVNGSAFQVSFWTFSMSASTAFLEVRVSNGSGVVPNNGGQPDNGLPTPLTGGVGDFTTLALTVNPTRATGGYPTFDGSFNPIWTQYTAILPAGVVCNNGYVAFRSYGTNVFGQTNTYKTIALDDVQVDTIVGIDIPWAVNADGAWSTAPSWVGSTVPDGGVNNAILGTNGGAITGARIVTNDAAHAVDKLTFESPAGYTIDGAGTLLIHKIISSSGANVISAPLAIRTCSTVDVAGGSSVSVTGTLDAAGKGITKTGAGSLTIPATTLALLNVGGGSVAISGAGRTTVQSLSVAAGSSLSIGSSTLAVDYTTGVSPLADLLAAIADGRLNSPVVSASKYAIGWVDTAGTGGAAYAADDTTLLFAATLRGDFNLDKTVNFSDLLTLAANYGTASSATWYKGDADSDGAVNFNDLLLLASNYNGSVTGSFAGDWSLAQSLAPEPTTLAAVGLIGITSLKRNRRHTRSMR
ncbi:MAG: choice-of-anchor J domain-containing protein [Tepidisphaeraceae bacterium]